MYNLHAQKNKYSKRAYTKILSLRHDIILILQSETELARYCIIKRFQNGIKDLISNSSVHYILLKHAIFHFFSLTDHSNLCYE